MEREVAGGLRLAVDGFKEGEAGKEWCWIKKEWSVAHSVTQGSEDREEGGLETRSMWYKPANHVKGISRPNENRRTQDQGDIVSSSSRERERESVCEREHAAGREVSSTKDREEVIAVKRESRLSVGRGISTKSGRAIR